MRPALRGSGAIGLVLGGIVLLAGTVEGQSFDGVYVGTLTCPALPGGSPFRTQLSMTVSGTTASFERPLVRVQRGQIAAEPVGSYERGTGTVTPSGDVVMHGKCDGGFDCDTEYTGRIDAESIHLAGTQRWRGRVNAERSCEIDLKLKR